MEIFSPCNSNAGLPEDDSYLECGLPEFLQLSLNSMKATWDRLDLGEEYLRWDCDYCNLQSDINSATGSRAWNRNAPGAGY